MFETARRAYAKGRRGKWEERDVDGGRGERGGKWMGGRRKSERVEVEGEGKGEGKERREGGLGCVGWWLVK